MDGCQDENKPNVDQLLKLHKLRFVVFFPFLSSSPSSRRRRRRCVHHITLRGSTNPISRAMNERTTGKRRASSLLPLLLLHATRCDATRCDAIHRNKTKTNTTTTTTAIKKGNTKSRSNQRRSSHTESFFLYAHRITATPTPRSFSSSSSADMKQVFRGGRASEARNKQSKVQSEYFVYVMFNYSGRRKRTKDRIGSDRRR